MLQRYRNISSTWGLSVGRGAVWTHITAPQCTGPHTCSVPFTQRPSIQRNGSFHAFGRCAPGEFRALLHLFLFPFSLGLKLMRWLKLLRGQSLHRGAHAQTHRQHEDALTSTLRLPSILERSPPAFTDTTCDQYGARQNSRVESRQTEFKRNIACSQFFPFQKNPKQPRLYLSNSRKFILPAGKKNVK